jgi:hypothetical protein
VTFIFQARGDLKLVQSSFADNEIKSRQDLEKRIEKAHEIAEYQFKRIDNWKCIASMHDVTLW